MYFFFFYYNFWGFALINKRKLLYVYIILLQFLKVSDQGNPAKTTSVQVNLRVTDVNDNAPVFNQTSVSFK